MTETCACGCHIDDHNSDASCMYEIDCGCTGFAYPS